MTCNHDCHPCRCAAEGERRKENTLATFEARRETIVIAGRRVLLLRLLESPTATADDVREALELPTGLDARCLGAVPSGLARAGIIRSAGYVRSERPERHASPIQVWTLADHAGAIAWLRTIPSLVTRCTSIMLMTRCTSIVLVTNLMTRPTLRPWQAAPSIDQAVVSNCRYLRSTRPRPAALESTGGADRERHGRNCTHFSRNSDRRRMGEAVAEGPR